MERAQLIYIFHSICAQTLPGFRAHTLLLSLCVLNKMLSKLDLLF